jgi:hypothetical protein
MALWATKASRSVASVKALEMSAFSRIWASFAVDLDGEAEGVVDLAAERGQRRRGVVEVGQPVEDGTGVVEVKLRLPAPVVIELGDRCFDLLALGVEDAYAVADERGIDAGLDRGELALEALIDVRAGW